MMKQFCNRILLAMLMGMAGASASAYDIAVENDDGVTLYYNYINDGNELELTYKEEKVPKGGGEASYIGYHGINKITIPSEVTYLNRTRKVTKIGQGVFYRCYELEVITIPPSIRMIDEWSFYWNSGLRKVIITDIAAWCECELKDNPLLANSQVDLYSDENTIITHLVIPEGVKIVRGFASCRSIESIRIPNTVTTIGMSAFADTGITELELPNCVTYIEMGAFSDCKNLSKIIFSNNLKTIEADAFTGCSSLVSITIPHSVETIGSGAFYNCDKIENVYSNIEDPFEIPNGVYTNLKPFGKNTYYNANLYVPKGSIDKYKATKGWKEFLFIEEGTEPNGSGSQDKEKCAKPTISYQNGKLIFNCATEGATCQYSITDDDIKSGSSNEVQLGVTYHISVYATKPEYENSETAIATLCWIDVEPKTEGITNSVANVRANPMLIQSNGSTLTISGAEAGTAISVYDTSGRMIGSTVASAGTTTIDTSIRQGEICILKIGEKSVKVLMK